MCAFSHICNDCVVFGSICFVSCLHVLCMYWHSLSSFFCSCPAPVFRIYDPPPLNCIFWPFLSCFTSSCVVSVRISVRLFCVPSTCIVSCIWLSFTLQSFFYLLSCPASVFLSWLCISSCLLLYKRHLFCWIGTKKQSSRHSVSTISSVYARVGEGGVREGHGPWVTPARALVFLNML